MVTFVFLIFVAMFAVAGFFISLEAKRRGDGQTEKPTAVRRPMLEVGRARSDGERAEGSRARAA
jgi:hypothetical protein